MFELEVLDAKALRAYPRSAFPSHVRVRTVKTHIEGLANVGVRRLEVVEGAHSVALIDAEEPVVVRHAAHVLFEYVANRVDVEARLTLSLLELGDEHLQADAWVSEWASTERPECRRTVSNSRMSSMLAKMTCSALSGRMGCRALRKTCARGEQVSRCRRAGRRRAHLDDELQTLHIALLGRDKLVARLLSPALSVGQAGQRRLVDQARPCLLKRVSLLPHTVVSRRKRTDPNAPLARLSRCEYSLCGASGELMTGRAFSLPTVPERPRRPKNPLTDDCKASLTATVVEGAAGVTRPGEGGGEGRAMAGESDGGARDAVRCSRIAR